MHFSRHSQLTPLYCAMVASLALSACGGGGDGAASYQRPTAASTNSELTATNYDQIGVPAVQAVQSAGTSRSSLDYTSGAVGSSSPESTLAAAKIAMAALKATQQGGAAQSKVNAIGPIACGLGGSISGSVNDADNSNSLSSGDAATLTFNNCTTSGNPSVGGTLAYSFVQVSSQSCGSIPCGTYDVTFTNLGPTSGIKLNGNARMVLSSTTLSVSYNGLTDGTSQLDMDVVLSSSSASNTFTMNGYFTARSQTFRVDTLVPFVGHTEAPNAGTLRVTDIKGNYIDVVSRGATVDVDYYTRGASTPTAFTRARSWLSF